MAEPGQSFRDFEHAGWEDKSVCSHYHEHLSSISKQTTFVERGFASCPPEGGTPSGPSEKVRLVLVPVEAAADHALLSPGTSRTFGSFHC